MQCLSSKYLAQARKHSANISISQTLEAFKARLGNFVINNSVSAFGEKTHPKSSQYNFNFDN